MRSRKKVIDTKKYSAMSKSLVKRFFFFLNSLNYERWNLGQKNDRTNPV